VDSITSILFGGLCAVGTSSAEWMAEPVVLVPRVPLGVVWMPDGSYAYFNRRRPTQAPVLTKQDGVEVAIGPRIGFAMPQSDRFGQRLLMDSKGELHEIIPRRRGSGRRIAVDRFIDLWHRKTTGGRARWERAKRIWEGYTGAVLTFAQLRSGRLVVPFGEWVADRPLGPPIGANVVTVVYSDDGGNSWRQSDTALTAPCFEGYNGSNLGACEPVVVQMKDGRVWMLMRTQTGFLYESWSRDGVHWSAARPSRFHSSTGPPGIVRLADGRLVLFWNNCEMPPRIDGQGVYGGRDAIHAAISSDDGYTWRGFREVYADPYRNETPPLRGDRGTAYPFPSFTSEGKVLLLTGQGQGRRNLVLIDPHWLTMTHREDDFSHGLDGWHVFKSFGPATHWWRDRTEGATLVEHPTRPGAKALFLRRPDKREPDGATWNFPLGWKGTLTLSLMLRRGFAGGSIALGDRMFEPCDDNGERLAVFHIAIQPNGQLGDGPMLSFGTWSTIELRWNLSIGECRFRVDGADAVKISRQCDTGNGICYLRLRSAAPRVDTAGFLVERVCAEISDPLAPPRTPKENRAAAQRYLKQMKGYRNRITKLKPGR